MADAAKSAFEGIFNKTKDFVGQAAETTKGLASQASQAVGKIIPGHNNVDPNAVPAEGAPAANGSADPNAVPSMQ